MWWFDVECKWYDCAGDNINYHYHQYPDCKDQIHRCNTPAETAEEYYRRTISIPFFDELLSLLNNRDADESYKSNGDCTI